MTPGYARNQNQVVNREMNEKSEPINENFTTDSEMDWVQEKKDQGRAECQSTDEIKRHIFNPSTVDDSTSLEKSEFETKSPKKMKLHHHEVSQNSESPNKIEIKNDSNEMKLTDSIPGHDSGFVDDDEERQLSLGNNSNESKLGKSIKKRLYRCKLCPGAFVSLIEMSKHHLTCARSEKKIQRKSLTCSICQMDFHKIVQLAEHFKLCQQLKLSI